jgi:hypothetical protein
MGEPNMAIVNKTYTTPTPLDQLQPKQLAKDLREAVAEAMPRLKSIAEEDAEELGADGKWSSKQIIGHLIDSAANNHQRFVRLQLEPTISLPGYEQDGWVRVQQYNQRNWADLLLLLEAMNLHLAHVIEHSDHSTYTHEWHSYAGTVTLGFIIEDYIAHLRHHLRQILG